MMFNKFAVFALLALTVLVVPAIGHPTKDVASDIEETAETVKHGIHDWLKNVKAKIVKPVENCTHSGVLGWVKNKLGWTKKSTTETPTTTTTAATTAAVNPEEPDYSGYVPITSVVANQGEPVEVYPAGPNGDVTVLDDSSATIPENDGGNEYSDVVPTYPPVADNVVDQLDSEIDVRSKF